MNTFRLVVRAMDTAAGADSVQHAIQLVPGVLRVRADPAANAVDVEAAVTVTLAELVNAVEKAGYEALLES
jgi:copper chaperone CopZ